MMFRTHLAFGFLVGLLSLIFLNIPNPYIYLLLVAFASIIVDIDTCESTIGKRIKTISWPIEKTIGHRNFFHSIFPLILMYIAFFYFLGWNVAGAALILGYGSHIFIDSFNRIGIGLFHPLSRKRITGFVKTGSIVEFFMFLAFTIVDVLIVINFFY